MLLVLGLAVLVAPLIAFAIHAAHSSASLHRQARATTEAFYAATSGLELALADLQRQPIFERVAAGPDCRPGTGDEEQFPFAAPPLYALGPCTVDVDLREPDTLFVTATAALAARTAAAGATQRVAAAVRRGEWYLPAALYSGSGAEPEIGPAFTVSGADRAGVVPAIPDRLLDNPSPFGPGTPPPFPLDLWSELVLNHPGAVELSPSATTPPSPGVFVSDGIFRADFTASGILVVTGDLHVSGRFALDGILLVLGDVEIAAGSEVEIRGALLQGDDARHLRLLGQGRIQPDSRVLASVDQALPGALLHRAEIAGWRQLF